MNTACHLQMLCTVLTGKLNPEALDWVLAANRLADDKYDHIPERHFDNAPNLEAIKRHWLNGLNKYMTSAINLARPEKIRLYRKRALQSFGYATHCIQDFYAHTNWVDIYAAEGVYDSLAPLTNVTFEIEKFPAGLSSGYYSQRFGQIGCPQKNGECNPPRPYKYCHEQIAKDLPDNKHGAEVATSDGKTFYEIVVALATRSTKLLWDTYYERIIDMYNSPDLFHEIAWGTSNLKI